MKIAIAILMVALAGCGSNVSSGVSIADARETCQAWDNDPAGFDASIIIAEALRDDGLLQSQFLLVVLEGCEDPEIDEGDKDACVVCRIAISAAVWR